MCRASFHAMGTLNTFSSLLIALHYSQEDVLGPMCPNQLNIILQLIQGPEDVCLIPWDMGGQAPSSKPSVLGHHRLFYHQETHGTSFCAPNSFWGPTWWLAWRVRRHPLVHNLWSSLTHVGTKRTQRGPQTTLHQHDVINSTSSWMVIS
jgi:hypothetical protein